MNANKAAESIIERRLKPIYDAIDSGNNKKAAQEADKVLKKHAGTHCAKALKALALVRSERQDEAWTLIDELEELDIAWDDNTLQALTHCFKELAAPARIAQLYEVACKRQPKNEQLLTHLFMAYVRTRDYKQQQKTAMALFKEFPKNPYYFWHIMSIVMQANRDPKLGRAMLLPLAEKMVLKWVESDSIEAEAEVQLYLMILDRQEKYNESLKVLQGPLGDKYLATKMWDRNYRELKLLTNSGQHDLVINRCFTLLQQQPDDWGLFTSLYDSAFALMAEQTERQSELISQLSDFVVTLVERCERGECDRVRGPFLARLHLIVRLLEKDLVVRAQLGEPLKLLTDYYKYFGDKPCCFADIQPYLWLLGEQPQGEFLAAALSVTGLPCRESSGDGSIEKFATNVEDAQRHITCLQLARSFGVHKAMDAGAKCRLARECFNRLKKAVDDKVEDLLAFEQYALIGVQLLWDVYSEQGDVLLLNEMVLVGEWVRAVSPKNAHMRLLLAKFYGMLGACTLVQELVQSLDVKYIQRDTLGYLLFDLLNNFGRFTNAVVYYVDLCAVFDQGEREVSDCLTTAYRNGAFPQIPDLVAFSDQSRASYYAVGADVQSRYLAAIFTADSLESLTDRLLDRDSRGDQILDAVDWSSVRDNRDFGVIPCFDTDGFRQRLADEAERTYQETVDWLRLKQLISSCLAALCREREFRRAVSEKQAPADQKLLKDADRPLLQLRTLTGQLKAHYHHCRSNYNNQSLATSLGGPPPTHFSVFLQGGYMEVVDCLFDCAYLLARHFDQQSTAAGEENGAATKKSSSAERREEGGGGERLRLSDSASPERAHVLPTADELQTLVRRMLASHQLLHVGTQSPPCSSSVSANGVASSTTQPFPHLQLAHCSWLLQALSVVVWTIRLVDDLSPSGGSSKKGKKKTSGVADQSPAVIQLGELAQVVASAPAAVDQLLADLELMMCADFESLCLSDNAVITNDQELSAVLLDRRRAVRATMHASYAESISEMRKFAGKLRSSMNKWQTA
uniref:N-terminal acetyltransferase B complex subunit NAA25 homolog n=1 Tax=Plectus sambesii TaxID=2011161 RepID=A0A914ULN6_9BILA